MRIIPNPAPATRGDRAAGDHGRDQDAAGAQALAGEIRLARAASLARAGQYEQAAALLVGYDGAAMLDLLGRIRAQQGRMAEARELWSRAVRQEPGNPTYRAARDRVLAARSARAWPRPSGVVALSVLVLAVVVNSGLAVAFRIDQMESRQREAIVGLQLALDGQTQAQQASASAIQAGLEHVALQSERRDQALAETVAMRGQELDMLQSRLRQLSADAAEQFATLSGDIGASAQAIAALAAALETAQGELAQARREIAGARAGLAGDLARQQADLAALRAQLNTIIFQLNR